MPAPTNLEMDHRKLQVIQISGWFQKIRYTMVYLAPKNVNSQICDSISKI
jgi:hypothetical protein